MCAEIFIYLLLFQGVRADGNPSLSDEIGKELSIRSSAAGLRYLLQLKSGPFVAYEGPINTIYDQPQPNRYVYQYIIKDLIPTEE